MKIEFGKNKPLERYCPICGLPVYEGLVYEWGNGCPKLHKIKAPKRDKKLHGKSKSVNRYYNYE